MIISDYRLKCGKTNDNDEKQRPHYPRGLAKSNPNADADIYPHLQSCLKTKMADGNVKPY